MAKEKRESNDEDPGPAQTEAEWLGSMHPAPLTQFIESRATDRKLRLFAVACCRHIWHLLADLRSKKAVEVAEAYSNGNATRAELSAARDAAWAVVEEVKKCSESWPNARSFSASAAYQCAQDFEREDRLGVQHDACWSAGSTALALSFEAVQDQFAVLDKRIGWSMECNVIRHIFGNPFRPYASPERWPSSVSDMAEVLYGGKDCALALHDALVEAGHVELAEHFRGEPWHPKGCWALDLILGKK